MKKVMFAGIAALCATVAVADSAIESQNIVGYNTTTAREGFSLFVPSFDDVGSEGLDIQKIVPNTLSETGIQLQTFTQTAGTDAMYYYKPAGGAGAGWYTKARARASDWAEKTFAKGEGFMVYFPTSGITFNVSGEVSLAAKTLENVRSGFTLMGNFRPTTYSIQKIVPDTTTEAGIQLQTFTQTAGTDTMYYYKPAGGAGAGWYTKARARASDWAEKTFEIGEGFMIYLPTSVDIVFQSAE